MKTISVLDFRNNARKIIRWSKQGQRMVMTYRGRPVMRLEPIRDEKVTSDDPFLQLQGIVVGKGKSLSNKEIDDIVYEK
jgi:antitoxin (DNA-binding transcriptional repressor) of toxin-antitoxin stability system